MEMDNFYNPNIAAFPYTILPPVNKGSNTPPDAMRGNPPTIKKGHWPCAKSGKWIQVEDHREETG